MINTEPDTCLFYHDGAHGGDGAAGVEGKNLTVTSRAATKVSI